MTHRCIATVSLLAVLGASVGCDEKPAQATSKSDTPTKTTAGNAPVAAANKPSAPAAATELPADKKPDVELRIEAVGNNMEFDKKSLTVKSGARVKLVFHNNATAEVMKHNWVLTNPGTDQKVGEASTVRGEAAGFIDPSPDLLVHTPLALAGKTVEVEFTAPAPGKYPYICTVLGHYVVMKGELIVE